jgi:hypothetical protein
VEELIETQNSSGTWSAREWHRKMKVQKHVAMLMLLLSCATAQNTGGPATVLKVTVARANGDLRVEITLSSPVKANADSTIHPHRILVDLPDATCDETMRTIEVNSNGVRRVRTAQHSSSPPITRIVLDLDQAHPYALQSEGNRIILTVSPQVSPRTASHGAPPAAASGSVIGIFRRKQKTPEQGSGDNSAPVALPEPPPPTTPVSSTTPTSSVVALPPAVQTTAPVPQSHPATASPEGSAGQSPFPGTQITSQPLSHSGDDVASTSGLPSGAVAASSPEIKHDSKNASKNEISAVSEPAGTAAPASSTASAAETTANSTLIVGGADPNLHTIFRVKYVAEGVAYLDGGSAAGLKEGMKLEVRDDALPARQGDSASAADPRIVAELEIDAVAETSSVTDIHTPKRPVKVGDLAYLSSSDAEALVQQRALSATRAYPAVISFTEGDTLDEEVREEIPRPPLPSVNRARGRIGFDYITTISHGTTSVTSSDVGMVFRGDITRIGGTYWNLSGYWRGRLTKSSATGTQTLQDLINRTYHLSMTYDNPNSSLVAGFGRLYLPWAPSLDTIDGGYFGTRLSKGTTLGIFGGSTPDPSSWDYSPNRAIGGTFVNFEGGEYNALHYSSTFGAGVSMVNWAIDRPFVFVEDSVSYKRYIAVYESGQLDSPRGNAVTPAPGPGLGRNFFTFRVNPHSRVELDFNYNYFRDIPTFDPTLIGTGLLDKYLFQGFSAGGRVEVMKQVFVSTNLGRSSGTGDAKASLNEMYGLTFGRLPLLKLRADAHYARFTSSFGTGSYESISVSRQLSEELRLEILAGQQSFNSTLTTNNRLRFVTSTVEKSLGPRYYVQGNFTVNSGQLSYDQFMFSLGYRFDSRQHRP